jgi:glycosyltransferase involved in cell wall biosynthesis
MTPLISIVTGTWNRLSYLKKMLESAARSIPEGITWEAVIVDGGSTDGTLEWCRSHPGVRLIEHGELRGAIPAFCDGARQAIGDYVILANDDITFVGDSILRALTYLERTPACGAVAFEDNRPAPGYPPNIYKTQLMNAVKDGRPTAVTYAQVGMFRRWIGDLCGWWGEHDSTMHEARTYGGDNFLSARIWQFGYTVDPVEGCRVDDAVAPDELRKQNYQWEQNRGSAYHRRFPRGPMLPSAPLPPNPQKERLRILYLPLYERGWGKYKRGLREALKRVGLVVEWDYLNDPGNLEALVASWQPHLLLTQFHDATSMAAQQLAAARRKCPSMVVANWNGDVYAESLLAPAMLDLLRHVDVQMVVNADVLAAYETVGINAAYWQIGFEPISILPTVPKHDVVFLGNAYSDQRRELESVLRSMEGVNVGIYGSGWQQADGNTLYDFETGAALYRSAKIAIGDNQWPDKGFVSNRLFEALGNGAFLLHQAVPGLEELIGLQDGVHYVAWSDFDDLRAKIEYYLAHEAERDAIAEDGEFSAHEFHSFGARVRELFGKILPGIKHRDTV